MKKVLFISGVVFIFLAMVSCAGKVAGMHSGETVMKARATVAAYEPGKWIKVPSGMPQLIMKGTDSVPNPDYVEYVTCDITPATEVKGEIKPGVRVLIHYTQIGKGPGSQATAVSIERIWD